MTRLAEGRSTHLTADEIASEVLRQFDTNVGEVGIRGLAKALGVSPSAIYHHFDSRDDMIEAAVALVWEEAIASFFVRVGLGGVDGLNVPTAPIDPVVFLEEAALATRRAFAIHFRIARYVGAAPDSTSRLGGALAIFGSVLEQMGLAGERAGEALYAYANYTIGSVLLAAARRSSAEERGGVERPAGEFATSEVRPADAPITAAATDEAMDHAIGVSLASIVDDEAYAADEALFLAGLRALIRGLTTT